MTEEPPLNDPSKFRENKARYFGKFAIRHRREMHKLIEGHLLGKDSKGWRNVAEHNLLAGVVANKIGRLVCLSEADLNELTSVAATHDWDKRLEKEKVKIRQEEDQSGSIIVETDIDKELLLEDDKKGLVRVTGNDWRDFSTWGLEEKILRYVDSSIIPTTNGHVDFVNWRLRIDDLRSRHSVADTKAGMALYGIPLYDKLAEITSQIERGLYARVIEINPNFQEKYPNESSLSDLIKENIILDIETGRRSS